MHSYSREETRAFTDYLNHLVAGDPDMQGKMPVNPESDDIFRLLSEGVLLCKVFEQERDVIESILF